jgi:DNA mismatch repair protein MutL
MSKIHILDKDLINKIAAGEVVERPASIVKELFENSIDAEANEIILNLENSGLSKIEVIDNGSGIAREDLKLAFVQHATSKISLLEDLDQIYTLGFRGEALASISSISDTTIHTFNGTDTPLILSQDNDQHTVGIGTGRQQGTTVTVHNIFSKVPARRKFLKSANTEYKYILDTFTAIAISHPEINFKLFKDSKLILNLTGNSTQLQRISELFPNLNSNNLLAINYDSPKIKITGYIGHPSLSRQDNSQQFIYVNQRYVKDGLIQKAVKEGYSSTLMNHNYPIYYLFIEIDRANLDVNIHPRKLEVKYSEPSTVFLAVRSACEKALSNSLKQEYSHKMESPRSNSFSNNSYAISPNSSSIQQALDFTSSLLTTQKDVSWTSQPVEQSNNDIESAFYNPTQIFSTYIIFEKLDRLLVVDQHAADERVNFEKIQRQLGAGSDFTSSDLLIPIQLSLSQAETQSINTYRSQILSYGFEFTTQKGIITISAVPLLLKNKFSENTFKELLQDLEITDGSKANAVEKQQNAIIATLACHSSIRAGQVLSRIEMQQLLQNLFKCQLPYSCPHGRPIIWELSKSDLEKNFKRKI